MFSVLGGISSIGVVITAPYGWKKMVCLFLSLRVVNEALDLLVKAPFIVLAPEQEISRIPFVAAKLCLMPFSHCR